MGIYTKPRFGAMLLALMCAGGTAYALLEDVLKHGAPITVDHVFTALALAATIGAGHYWWDEAKRFRVVSVIFLTALFLGGTAYVVTTSAARIAETRSTKVSDMRAGNDAGAEAKKDYREAKTRYDAALKAEGDECGSGEGDKCKARRRTTAAHRVDLDKAEAKLANAPAPKVENGGLKKVAKAFASFPGVTSRPEEIEERIDVLVPFVTTAIAELATITFSRIARIELLIPWLLSVAGMLWPKPANDNRASAAPSTPPRPGRAAPANDEGLTPAEAARRAKMVADFVGAYRAKHGKNPRTRDVVKACKLPKASASRWRARALG